MGRLYGGIRYPAILVALVAGGAASFWVHRCPLGTFWTLAVSAVLFFGVYGGVLLLLREPLTAELVQQIFRKLKRKTGKEA